MAEEIPRSTTLMGDGAAAAAPSLSLRPVESSDEALLLRIFAESHCAGFELTGLEPAALAGLIRMQFQARQAQYRMHPGAADYLIRCDGGSADLGEAVLGSCWLSDSAEQLRVLDIAVLVEHRRRGIARAVLTQLCARATAAGKPVRLSVWRDNHPAVELYRALGFLPDPTVGGSTGDQHGEPGDLGNGYLELLYAHRDLHQDAHDLHQDTPEAATRQRAGAR
jgi:ribosomal protein S18 acetylase RimI-like enzyme